MKYKCLCSNKNYLKKVAENLKKQFFDICQFSSHDINMFILLLRKDLYPYEYMDDQEKFHETSLHKKEDFYSYLNMEDITGSGYTHAKGVYKDFRIKNIGEYLDLQAIHYCQLMYLKTLKYVSQNIST